MNTSREKTGRLSKKDEEATRLKPEEVVESEEKLEDESDESRFVTEKEYYEALDIINERERKLKEMKTVLEKEYGRYFYIVSGKDLTDWDDKLKAKFDKKQEDLRIEATKLKERKPLSLIERENAEEEEEKKEFNEHIQRLKEI